METTPKNLSTFAINQIAKQQSITTTPSLPWSKTFSFQNSKQWYFFSHLQAAQNTIHYCKTNNIPFLLIPNNHTHHINMPHNNKRLEQRHNSLSFINFTSFSNSMGNFNPTAKNLPVVINNPLNKYDPVTPIRITPSPSKNKNHIRFKFDLDSEENSKIDFKEAKAISHNSSTADFNFKRKKYKLFILL